MLPISLITFFISGVSALIYQICWQRLLFATIGVDIDSVTIIVSVFMCGLGLGGLLGGKISDKFPRHLISIYGCTELFIGLYGANSEKIFNFLNSNSIFLASSSHSLNVIGCFLALIIPTLLMGITLPILTMALNIKNQNIGSSVGLAYFTNTVGAALGSIVVPFMLFDFMSLAEVVHLAVVGNIFSALLILTTNSFIEQNN